MPAKPSRRIGYAPAAAARSFIRYSLFAIRYSLASGGSQRYFYHQDANYRVCSLTSESGAVVQRYEYDAYGEPRVFGGVASSGAEGAAPLAFSGVGNPYLHQGLRRDDECGLHENRYRTLHSRLGRFMQRDPLGYVDGMSRYSYLASNTLDLLDPLGESRIRNRIVGWIGGLLPQSWTGVVIILKDGTRVVVHPKNEMELKAIIEQYRSRIAEIHIYGHGSVGTAMVGDGSINKDNVRNILGLLPGVVIKFWNCDTAQGSSGRTLLQAIANATGTCVTGSTDDCHVTPFGPQGGFSVGEWVTVCPEPVSAPVAPAGETPSPSKECPEGPLVPPNPPDPPVRPTGSPSRIP